MRVTGKYLSLPPRRGNGGPLKCKTLESKGLQLKKIEIKFGSGGKLITFALPGNGEQVLET
ncbi:hypothetical protein COR50_08620 [Chitinophaga caeni]|uniref:Uncharacterized protein n=1 Tax=Chitinophaga caeni TaxID=2029983 RepID=A0A291QTQ6_9BACT|nr:hypothetical protein COR50_08620 [Chitinophaga caeni]